MLENPTSKIGALIIHLPKHHIEIAREGIEWGNTKMLSRRQKLKDRGTVQIFRLVEKCTL